MSDTATASTIQISPNQPTLMLAFELGEKGWKLGFSTGFGQEMLERNIGTLVEQEKSGLGRQH